MFFRTALIVAGLAVLPFNSGLLFAQDAAKYVVYYLQSDSVVVADVTNSNEFLAYGKTVGKWNRFTFPQGVRAIPVVDDGVFAFSIEGEKIAEIVAVDLQGNWHKLTLPVPAKKCVPRVSEKLAVYVVNGNVHAFSGELGKWDSVEGSAAPELSDDTAVLSTSESLAVFSAATGKWAVAKEPE